jgi:hypothetical protein
VDGALLAEISGAVRELDHIQVAELTRLLGRAGMPGRHTAYHAA